MRRDENDNLVTLEEDIRRLWKQHGLIVIFEKVESLQSVGLKGSVWTIRAEEER